MKERQNEYRRKGEKEKHEFKSKNLINFSPYPYHRLAISLLCLSQPGPRLPSVSFTPFSLPVYHQNHLSPNTLENLNCWNVFITMWKGWKFGEKSSLKLEKKRKKEKIVYSPIFRLQSSFSIFSPPIFFLENGICVYEKNFHTSGPRFFSYPSAIQHWKSSKLCR